MIVSNFFRYTVTSVIVLLIVGIVTVVSQNKFARILEEKSIFSPEMESVESVNRQLACMTENIYHEAGKEPIEGKIAVAQVVMNRVESGKFPTDPCRVIYQKNKFYEKVVCQFSWYCDKSVRKLAVNKERWDESNEVAKMVLLEGMRLPSLTNALYYHADYVNPRWKNTKVAKIGQHIFYKDI